MTTRGAIVIRGIRLRDSGMVNLLYFLSSRYISKWKFVLSLFLVDREFKMLGNGTN
jgi:hypothetical protein